MCAVSFVSDYYQNQWPLRFPDKPVETFPADIKKELLEILKRLDKIDKRLGDIECKDEAKKAFIESLSNG